MKLARTGIIAAAVLALSSVAFAQAKPDFSGTWTPDTVAAPAAPTTPPTTPPAEGRGRGMTPSPMTVVQTADTLTIERTMGENKVTTVYKLDGTESENKMMGRGGTEVVSKSTAKWDGNRLTITTKQAAPDGTERTSTQSWSMEGANLVVESTRTGREGTPVTTKTVYKKST
jgi:hypothetical protein